MKTIEGKNILITGGAMGLGKIFARKALEEGGQVILWDINRRALQETQKELARLGKVSIYTVDLANPGDIFKVAQKTIKNIKQIHILINNAGIVTGHLFQDHSPEEIAATMAVNALAPMYVARAFLDNMLQFQHGHIVNLASAAGLIPNPRMSVYAASKWSVVGWSESLRIEMESQPQAGIKVTTVQPSYINTGMFAGVKAPLLTPILDPEKAVAAIWEGIKHEKIIIRLPFMVQLIPLLRGILTTRLFDLIAGKIFGVYHTMETFTGRRKELTKTEARGQKE